MAPLPRYPIKKTARHLNIRRRYNAITSNEVITAERYRKIAIVAAIKYNNSKDENIRKIAAVAHIKYLRLISDLSPPLTKPLRRKISVDIFTESDCYVFFAFRQEHLSRLFKALRIPDKVHLENGSVMTGEEIALRGLYELVNGDDQHHAAMLVFGREASQQSRATRWFYNHIFESFADLLFDNLEWWYSNGFLEESRKAIEQKVASYGVTFEPGTFPVCAFIDCNCLETARPGGGPRSDGHAADRWDNYIQRAFYNGWKSTHGLKHQTSDIAHGMTIHMYGPASLRRNDLRLLGQSQLVKKFRDMQIESTQQLIG